MSAWHGGKGSGQRPTDMKKYRDNPFWDKKKDTEETFTYTETLQIDHGEKLRCVYEGMGTTRLVPDADCGNCRYGGEYEGGHCYMFQDKPGDKCGQFKPKLNSTKGRE